MVSQKEWLLHQANFYFMISYGQSLYGGKLVETLGASAWAEKNRVFSLAKYQKNGFFGLYADNHIERIRTEPKNPEF